ncbi:MAG: ABC transporter permease [Planctomycetota bacterium]|nr:ABC transporter permease [Planctomycetota bacterium]
MAHSGELIRLATGALGGHRLRTLLSVLGIAIGVTAVMVLTSIGQGTRDYVLGQFTQFGTNIVAVNPGKTETLGLPGIMGGTTHKLTLDDAEALLRIPAVEHLVPLALGQGRVEAGGRGRSVAVYGVTSQMPAAWRFELGVGEFLPPGDPRRGSAVAVLGPNLKAELFGEENALGEWVRAAGVRLRVIGVMKPKGQVLGIDLDDTIYVPVATAMEMFNLAELFEIDMTYAHAGQLEQLLADVRRVLTERHGGREDFTITTQEAMLDVFGNVMEIITLAVGAIGGISLLVGAIGILTMMWIAVGERTSEIGLLRAVGAERDQVLGLFLWEAVLLSACGGLAGIGAGFAFTALVRALMPGLPLHTPPEYVATALGVSVVVGLLSGVLPAARAASLDPIEALRAE